MIPTTFVIPPGYIHLKTGERKREGDLYLNRVCQSEYEWAWSAHVESGTDWNTLVRHDQTVIRPIAVPAPPDQIPSTGKMIAPPDPPLDAMALEIILKDMETTPFAVSIWTIRDWALVLRAEFTRLQAQYEEMLSSYTDLANLRKQEALSAPSTQRAAACDAPSHRQAFELVFELRAQATKCINAGTDIGASYVFAWLGNIARHLTAVALPIAEYTPAQAPAQEARAGAGPESMEPPT